MKKTHVIATTVFIYLLLQSLIGYFFFLRFKQDINEQTAITQKHFINTYHTIFGTFRKTPKAIVDGVLDRPYITNKIAQANKSKKKKKLIRKELFKVLNPIYKDTLLPIHIDQLEIYLKNGERLLQLKEPLKFGDTPLMQNAALQKVTSLQKLQEGISEESNQLYYNYYFPILSKGKHIGTFHIGIPLKSYIDKAKLTLENEQQVFILQDKNSKDLDKKIKESYSTSKDFMEIIKNQPQRKKEALSKLLSNPKSLSMHIKDNSIHYTLHGLPLFDFEENLIGFILSKEANKTIPRLYFQMIQDNIVFALILILAFILAFSYKKQLELYEHIKQHKDHLEDIVSERTEELARSNAFMNTLFHTIPSPVFIKDLDDTFIECNDAFLNLMQLPREKVIGKKTREVLSHEKADEAISTDKHVYEKQKQYIYEATFNETDTQHDFIIYKNILKQDNEEIGILGVMQDISAKKAYQERLEKTLAENFYQQDLLEEDHQIIDHFTIFTKCDSKGNIKEVSTALCNISGYSEKELLGKRIEFLYEHIATKQDIEALLYAIDNKCQWEGNMPGLRKDGNQYWLRLTMIPKHSKSGEFEHFMIFGTDISNEMHIKGLSIRDELTSAFNRKKLNETLGETLALVKRYEENAAFVILDIDNFKSINDTYGHLVGDSVLKELSKLMQDNIRDVDIFARWGGEEFAIVVPKISAQNALKLTEKLRTSIITHEFEHIGSLTCSFGLTQIKPTDETLDETIARADEALYDAKNSGKNRIIVLG